MPENRNPTCSSSHSGSGSVSASEVTATQPGKP
jgi:hypothetical protein